MSRISQSKVDRIKENILQNLFEESPRSLFTYEIADGQARDKEFVLKLLLDLESKKLVKQAKKDFSRKRKWALTDEAYSVYKDLL